VKSGIRASLAQTISFPVCSTADSFWAAENHSSHQEFLWDANAKVYLRIHISLPVKSIANRVNALGITELYTLFIVRNCNQLENTTFRKLDLFSPSSEGKMTPTLLGHLEWGNLNRWTNKGGNRLGVSFPSAEDGNNFCNSVDKCRIWGSHRCTCIYEVIVRYVMLSVKSQPTFRRNILCWITYQARNKLEAGSKFLFGLLIDSGGDMLFRSFQRTTRLYKQKTNSYQYQK
jgi:hypothetical protein